MPRRLRFSNYAPAVSINGQWFGCVARTIAGSGCTLHANERSAWSGIWLPCSQAEAESLIQNAVKPALVVDGRVYVAGALTIGSNGHIESTGGYLGSVRQTLAWGIAERYPPTEEEPETRWWTSGETASAEFDALGVVRAEYSGGLRISGLRIPTVYSGANIPRFNSYQERWLGENWPLTTILEETNQNSNDGPFSGSSSTGGGQYIGQFVSSTQSEPPSGASGSGYYATSRCNWIGRYAGIAVDFSTS